MFTWLQANFATLVVLLVLTLIVTSIVVSMIRARKQGKSSCGCAGCGGSCGCGSSCGCGAAKP